MIKIDKNNSYIDVVEKNGTITSWVRDVDGVLHVINSPAEDYYYLFMPANGTTSDYVNIYNEPMRKVSFRKKFEMKNYSAGRKGICESDVQPRYKFIIDNFFDTTPDAPYNVLYYDIETDFDLSTGDGYPTPANPFGQINAISCFDYTRKEYFMFMFDHLKNTVQLKDKEYPVNIVWCEDERDLLLMFSAFLDEADIDCLAGWNVNAFDLLYIMERSIILFGEPFAKSMYCRNGFDASKRSFVNEHKEETWEWNLVGRQHLDMMALYKKLFPGEKKSFSLDNVCSEDIGISKMEYDGDLGELYRTDPQKFMEYSLHDSRLLLKLDEKRNIIKMTMMLSRENCVLGKDVTGSVKLIEMSLIKFCRKKGNIVLPDKVEHEKNEKFEGAIVYDTIAGLHKWAFTVDLGSLYPSTMIMLGISAETMLFQLKNEYYDYIKVMEQQDSLVVFNDVRTEEEFSCTAAELFLIIKENGFTISANGTIFSGELGLLSEYVKQGFDQRKHYQNMMKIELEKGNKDIAQRYSLLEKVIKIRNNSVYGATGEKSFFLYDLRISKSITISAQIISKQQAMYANMLMDKIAADLQ